MTCAWRVQRWHALVGGEATPFAKAARPTGAYNLIVSLFFKKNANLQCIDVAQLPDKWKSHLETRVCRRARGGARATKADSRCAAAREQTKKKLTKKDTLYLRHFLYELAMKATTVEVRRGARRGARGSSRASRSPLAARRAPRHAATRATTGATSDLCSRSDWCAKRQSESVCAGACLALFGARARAAAAGSRARSQAQFARATRPDAGISDFDEQCRDVLSETANMTVADRCEGALRTPSRARARR